MDVLITEIATGKQITTVSVVLGKKTISQLNKSTLPKHGAALLKMA
jgi:hypothetical protein